MESIMYPSINMGDPTNKLGPNDVQRITDRYGARNMPNWVIRYFIERRNMGFDFW